MSAKADNLVGSYSEQLSEFDTQLRDRSDNTATIPDLTGTIKRLLLGNTDSESDIRGILHKRLQDGHIHDDTFRLVLGVLDGFVSEEVPTIPGVVPLSPEQQDGFVSEAVTGGGFAPRLKEIWVPLFFHDISSNPCCSAKSSISRSC